MTEEPLVFRDHEGLARKVRNCTARKDRAGRYWLWCDQTQTNLAIGTKTREDMLLEAIDSLLFTLQLRDERITALQRIADLANEFADQIKPDESLED